MSDENVSVEDREYCKLVAGMTTFTLSFLGSYFVSKLGPIWLFIYIPFASVFGFFFWLWLSYLLVAGLSNDR